MTLMNSIKCPNCGTQVEVTDALYRQAEAEIQARWDVQAKEIVQQATEQVRAQEREKSNQELEGLRQQLAITSEQLELWRQKETQLHKAAVEIEQRKADLATEIEAKLRQLAVPLREQLRKRVSDEIGVELQDLKNRLSEQATKLENASSAELEHRRRVRELEDEKSQFDLAVQRKLDAQREELESALRLRYAGEADLKLREKDQLIDRLRQAVEELKRKSEQGSVELQGEILELDIEAKLRAAFPQDIFSAVARGVRGADVLHVVRNKNLEECGIVIWEAKNSKNWSSNWIDKLKEDQREVGANLAVLVTISLPRDVTHFGMVDGVVVCSHQCVLPVALFLRERLEQVKFAGASSQARSEKTELIFDYVAGDGFRHQVEAIIEAFDRMRNQIDREKRAMEKQWKEREKLLEIVMTNTSRMYGDIRGIAGAAVKEITHLELETDLTLIEGGQPLDSA